MAEETTTTTLIRTKLHRFPIPEGHVHRPRLLERLEQNRQRPLTLVSAPAGYGKSTLVSSWLQGCACPNAWVSLDQNDNDLNLFLNYFLAAIQTMFPDAASETMTLVDTPTLPPLSILATSLVNELDLIEQDFILVLDDILLIREESVFNLLTELLRHPPRSMHLVVIGRRKSANILWVRPSWIAFAVPYAKQCTHWALTRRHGKSVGGILLPG